MKLFFRINRIIPALAVIALLAAGCSTTDAPFIEEPPQGGGIPGGNQPGGSDVDDAGTPDFDTPIQYYNGQLANDGNKDVVGTDKDIYWEANKFDTKISVDYNGATATVSGCDVSVQHLDGAHVVLDLASDNLSGVEIILSGKSDDGSLKIYSNNKLKLTLDGVELTSSRGPAINSQCKKRIFVNLTAGTVNKLTDAKDYADDIWYTGNASAETEDRKGTLFSEGHLIFSGTGSLLVAGRQKHAIASDGYMITRPGVTIAVTEAAKNAIHIKGDTDEDTGIRIMGGLIYANVSSEAGKAIKTDVNVEISGGSIDLNTSGTSIYDSTERDTSSPAGIKADGNITISGGTVSVKSTGAGGKGLNADGAISITGGNTTLVTSGITYRYNASLSSSPKAMKADGDIVIDDGVLNVAVTGTGDGSEGIESKSALTVNGGEIYVHAYDDAINAATGITVNGGRIFAYSSANDAIDSNGFLQFNGGVVIAAGAGGMEESFDCDNSSRFLIDGGTLIGLGGTSMAAPSSSSKQRTVLYGKVSVAKDNRLAILDSTGKLIDAITIPRTMSNMVLFYSSPVITSGASFTISKDGTVTDSTESWEGWTSGGKWSDGTTVGTFTSSSVVTMVGSTSSGPGGGMPGRPW